MMSPWIYVLVAFLALAVVSNVLNDWIEASKFEDQRRPAWYRRHISELRFAYYPPKSPIIYTEDAEYDSTRGAYVGKETGNVIFHGPPPVTDAGGYISEMPNLPPGVKSFAPGVMAY